MRNTSEISEDGEGKHVSFVTTQFSDCFGDYPDSIVGSHLPVDLTWVTEASSLCDLSAQWGCPVQRETTYSAVLSYRGRCSPQECLGMISSAKAELCQ